MAQEEVEKLEVIQAALEEGVFEPQINRMDTDGSDVVTAWVFCHHEGREGT